jgi:phosphorylcholine metabolism protein LicD
MAMKSPTRTAVYGHRDKRFASFNESPEEIRERLIVLLLALKEMCDRVGVEFWLECGTLLGAFRNQDFIPHDPDADVGILYTDLVKLQNKNPSDKNHLFEFDPNWTQRQPDKKSQVDARIIDTLSGIYIDIFGFSEQKKGRYVSKWVGFNGIDIRIGAYPGIFYDRDELFPLNDCTLHGIKFKSPRETRIHLQRMYGNKLSPPAKYSIVRFTQRMIAKTYYYLVLARKRRQRHR